MKKIFYFSFMILSLAFISCGDDDVDCTSNNFVTSINALIDDLNAAVATYNSDPTSDNCEALKQAARDYLDGVEDFGDCSELDQTQYQDQLDQARDAVDTIGC